MPLFFCKSFLFVAFVCLIPINFAQAQFTFDFNVDPNLIDSSTNTSTGVITPTQQTQLAAALTNTANFWQQYLVGFQPGVSPDLAGINIQVGFTNFADANGVADGPLGTLASGGTAASIATSGGFDFAVDFSTLGTSDVRLLGGIFIDSADFNSLGTPLFDNVLNHEVAHALGFGDDLFIANDVYINESGQYTGVNGLAAYQAEFDPTATFVPIELDGGEGTRNSHINERTDFTALEDVIPNPNGLGFIADPGGENDPGDLGPVLSVLTSGATQGLLLEDALLTSRISGDPDNFLSDTTVAIFQDLGFEVVLPSEVRAAAVPEPSHSFVLIGLAGIAVFRRQKS